MAFLQRPDVCPEYNFDRQALRASIAADRSTGKRKRKLELISCQNIVNSIHLMDLGQPLSE
jgi:hypothetical protein